MGTGNEFANKTNRVTDRMIKEASVIFRGQVLK